LQSAALPLGYAANAPMERETGFEPATSTLARLRSTIELFPLLAIRIIDIAFFVKSDRFGLNLKGDQ
jgi:hypothetical protein